MKKIVIIAIILIAVNIEFSYSTPSTQIWIPSTDVQGFGTWHLGLDNYLRTSNYDLNGVSTRGGTIYCAGLTAGVLPFKKLQGEVGVDYFTMSDPVYDNHPLLFNIKLALPEDSLFKNCPAVAFGVYNVGTKTNLTNYNMYYGLIAKTIPVIGRLSAGYYVGNKTILLDDKGKASNSGLLISWDRTMTEISDKLWIGVDYQGGNNSYGALSFGASWAFSKNVSVILGYDIWNDQNVAYNSKDRNVNTFTTQLDINF